MEEQKRQERLREEEAERERIRIQKEKELLLITEIEDLRKRRRALRYWIKTTIIDFHVDFSINTIELENLEKNKVSLDIAYF